MIFVIPFLAQISIRLIHPYLSHTHTYTHLFQKSVAPDLPISPGPCDDASVVIVSALGPVSPLYAGDQAFARVRHSHLIVFTGCPEHRPALVIILNPQGKLAMIIVDLPHPALLTVVYRQHVPVVSLNERKNVKLMILLLPSTQK